MQSDSSMDPRRCLVHGLTRVEKFSGPYDPNVSNARVSWWECPLCMAMAGASMPGLMSTPEPPAPTPSATWYCNKCGKVGDAATRARAEKQHAILSPTCDYSPAWVQTPVPPASAPPRTAYAFPVYACERCWHGESELTIRNKVLTACPKCGGTMREVGIPVTDAPQPCDLLCLVCARVKPWGIWDQTSGVAVCVGCRDKARSPATVVTAPPPLDAAARDELARKANAVIAARRAHSAALPSWSMPVDSPEYAAFREAGRAFDRAQREYDDAVRSPDVILALLAAVERGGADTARMDWWESERPRVGLGEDNVVRLLDRWNDGALLASEPTMREAIDAARSPQPGTDDGQ